MSVATSRQDRPMAQSLAYWKLEKEGWFFLEERPREGKIWVYQGHTLSRTGYLTVIDGKKVLVKQIDRRGFVTNDYPKYWPMCQLGPKGEVEL